MSQHGAAPVTRTILCGTDFSDGARDAASIAAVLATTMGAKLRLVHVLDTGPLMSLGQDERRKVRDSCQRAIDAEIRTLVVPPGLAVEGLVIDGNPGRALADAASELGASLIVVAAVSRMPSMIRVGGTAERVAQWATIPVLIVRDPTRLRRGLEGERLSVAAFLAGDAASERAVGWLRLLRDQLICDITALRGYYVDEAARHYGLAPRPLVQADRDIEAYLGHDLEVEVGSLGGHGAVACHAVLAIGRLADHLLADPASERAGLIVVGNHHTRGFARLSSTASAVVHLASASVLLVPAEAPEVAPVGWPVIRRIVVATDLSPFASAAIRHAYGLAAAGGGQIVLLHVMTAPSSPDSRAEILERLQALVPTLPPRGVTTRVEAIWHDNAATGISTVAARTDADVIVITSHGRSGLRRVLLGSVAQELVQRDQRPVLVVRPPADA